MAYIRMNNITSPACIDRLLASISQTPLDLTISLGVNNSGKYTSCSETPSSYKECTSINYSNALHPCSRIKAILRTYAVS